MQIVVIGTTLELLHFTKHIERSPDYTNVRKPSEIYPINGGKDKGYFRRRFTVRQIVRPMISKKKKKRK